MARWNWFKKAVLCEGGWKMWCITVGVDAIESAYQFSIFKRVYLKQRFFVLSCSWSLVASYTNFNTIKKGVRFDGIWLGTGFRLSLWVVVQWVQSRLYYNNNYYYSNTIYYDWNEKSVSKRFRRNNENRSLTIRLTIHGTRLFTVSTGYHQAVDANKIINIVFLLDTNRVFSAHDLRWHDTSVRVSSYYVMILPQSTRTCRTRYDYNIVIVSDESCRRHVLARQTSNRD